MINFTEYLNSIMNNSITMVLLIFIILDSILGTLRAIKDRKFNSTIGIDGCIRKVAMIFCVMILSAADLIMSFNLVGFIPNEIADYLGNPQIGICEFFSLLFILYEAISILKNMTLCGLPISKRLNEKLKGFLNIMTDELHNKDDDSNK
jgi:toxin secretion/phage lysis holin